MLFALCAAPSALAAPLMPDLRTRPLPTGAADPRIITAGDGTKQFAFSNGWSNHGQGPWEIIPAGPPDSDDCDGDGDASNDVAVNQSVYQDANGNGVFERGTDTGVEPHSGGCMIYHPQHSHFHINDAGVYALISEATGQPLGSSSKVSFCLLDVGSFDLTLPGAPSSSYYKSSCSAGVQGISVGWYDRYSWNVAGQQIDLDGAAAGNYCLHSEADPLNRFLETNDANNAAEQRYFVDPANFQVTALSGPCNLQPLPETTITSGLASAFTVDTDAPQTTISGRPKGRTTDRTPTFHFESSEPSTLECRLDRRPWRRCSSPKSYRRLSLGAHVFKARATDQAANEDPTSARRRFRVVERP
ncbi:MAG: lysyl oxidase family protein [Actinomycetota bacterium]